jgi:hypothetical protein
MTSGQLVPLDTSLTQVTTTDPQLSLATTRLMSGVGTLVAHSTVTAAGQVINGAMLSLTVMVWVQVVVLPQESAAW